MLKKTLWIAAILLLCSGPAFAGEMQERQTCNATPNQLSAAAEEAAKDLEAWAKERGLRLLDSLELQDKSLTTCPFVACSNPSCNITLSCSGLQDTGLSSCSFGNNNVGCGPGKTIWINNCACNDALGGACGSATTQIVCQ
ncbi:hypothetical protein ABI59_20105 [Acidobacteria bacterium Mor1]|nr:hypothetical protein ABI59_20105 [Acidobacteria bacterium Mor1]